MANYSQDDRRRSIRRFLMATLGAPPWRVITERRTVKDDQRPIGLVETATPAVTTVARVSIPQGNVTRAQTFSIMLWPALVNGSGGLLTAPQAGVQADEVAELLARAIGLGLTDDNIDPDVFTWETCPERLPVFDYAGVPTEKVQGRVIPQDAYGWLWVEEYPVRAIQDPEDTTRFTIVCDMRVSWEQAGRRVPAAPLVGSMPPRPLFEGEGEIV